MHIAFYLNTSTYFCNSRWWREEAIVCRQSCCLWPVHDLLVVGGGGQCSPHVKSFCVFRGGSWWGGAVLPEAGGDKLWGERQSRMATVKGSAAADSWQLSEWLLRFRVKWKFKVYWQPFFCFFCFLILIGVTHSKLHLFRWSPWLALNVMSYSSYWLPHIFTLHRTSPNWDNMDHYY